MSTFNSSLGRDPTHAPQVFLHEHAAGQHISTGALLKLHTSENERPCKRDPAQEDLDVAILAFQSLVFQVKYRSRRKAELL